MTFESWLNENFGFDNPPNEEKKKKSDSFTHTPFCQNTAGSDGHDFTIKGEIRNRFHLISEERVKHFEQNSENLMKIG